MLLHRFDIRAPSPPPTPFLSSAHQHLAIRNASLCLKGVSERCHDSRAIVVPSIDALAQDLDLDELLILHKAWADWFYSRLPPIEWRYFSHVRADAFPTPAQRRVIVVYASSHTWMNHGSHMTLRSMFPEHDDERIQAVHLIMVGDQVSIDARARARIHRIITTHMTVCGVWCVWCGVWGVGCVGCGGCGVCRVWCVV
jgi:hypothetical protein